jgi:organic hydroperoxide reductase OsmC/OhrA
VRLDCEVDATLDRKDRLMQFTKVVVHARLVVPASMDLMICERVLQKAEHGCLVANSLRCERELQTEIVRRSVAQPESAVA